MPWVEGEALTPTNLNAIGTGTFIISVTDPSYGASGDSATDNAVALQAAASAITAGGTLYFPPGTYLVSSPIYIPAGTIVRGAGRNSSIIKRKNGTVTNSTATNQGAVIIWGPSSGQTYGQTSRGSFCAIESITIDGGVQTGLTDSNRGAHGMRADYLDELYCNGVVFQNCYDSGAYLFGTRRSKWLACSAYSNGRITVASSRNGYSITGSSAVDTSQGSQDQHIFLGCDATNNKDAGFVIGRNGLVQIIGCTSRDNGDKGIEGDSGAQGSDVTNVPAGIIVQGCYLFNNAAEGIALQNSNVQRYMIFGNSVESSGKAGISVAATSNSVVNIYNNSIRTWGSLDASMHAIQVADGFDEVNVGSNIIDGGTTAGIVVLASATTRRVAITGNVLRNVGNIGMSLAGSVTGIISGNIVDNCGNVGVDVNASTHNVTSLVLANNYVKNSGDSIAGSGIRLRTTGSTVSGVWIIGNVSTDDQAVKTQTYGLEFSESTTSIANVRVVSSDFTGNATGQITGLGSWMTTSALTTF